MIFMTQLSETPKTSGFELTISNKTYTFMVFYKVIKRLYGTAMTTFPF